jgi:pilus assembly protein Flp/PilA
MSQKGASKIARQTRRFVADERAATAIEYAIIAAGIAGAIAIAITALGGSVQAMWNSVKDAFT